MGQPPHYLAGVPFNPIQKGTGDSKSARPSMSFHVLWIGIAISLVVALYLAYLEAVSATQLDFLLPRVNVTQLSNGTAIIQTRITNGTAVMPETIHPPFIPRFIIIWGYIGAATYGLKVTTRLIGKGKFKKEYIPDHIARLFVGTAVAIVAYFILST